MRPQQEESTLTITQPQHKRRRKELGENGVRLGGIWGQDDARRNQLSLLSSFLSKSSARAQSSFVSKATTPLPTSKVPALNFVLGMGFLFQLTFLVRGAVVPGLPSLMVRACILARASSSRLGENSKSSPWFCSSILLRRPILVLSDALFRSSENGSPKRVLEQTRCALCSCPRPGEELYKSSARAQSSFVSKATTPLPTSKVPALNFVLGMGFLFQLTFLVRGAVVPGLPSLMVRACILARASSSRLGENSKSSPWFCSSILLRRPILVLSDALFRSSENGSPKRVLEQTRCALCSCPRPGEEL
ncbi:hypothetical protein DEO72_LG4g42 [Vigna unguiculata]|uniref:Uncharacterized protein n=1 Tax=Vigna unguiculata TaxID=3917 RepID=A0A4D6LM34_VIGUN|nr:hypothetical protein DEO72_LG4g42 [Vigna unguiculata]